MRILASGIAALVTGAALVGLAGCGEKPQDRTERRPGTTVTRDTKPWNAEPNEFSTRAYPRGDHVAWEKALRDRAQAQNEYNRVP